MVPKLSKCLKSPIIIWGRQVWIPSHSYCLFSSHLIQLVLEHFKGQECRISQGRLPNPHCNNHRGSKAVTLPRAQLRSNQWACQLNAKARRGASASYSEGTRTRGAPVPHSRPFPHPAAPCAAPAAEARAPG
jgi:hypothetical protein